MYRFALHFVSLFVFAVTLQATASAAPCTLNSTDPSVTICSPSANASVSDPVSLVAGSTDSAGVTGMAIYVDNNLVQKVNGNQISASGTFSAGQHYMVAQLWDNAGRIIQQSENFTVLNSSGTCTPASPAPSVTICSPTNGSTVASPVHVVAVPNSNTGVTGMAVYFDNSLVYEGNVSSVDQYINAGAGSHYVVVQYWDNNGNVPAKASVNIDVTTSTPAPTISFSANPTSIASGQSSTLSWSTTNATSVTIDNGIGSQPTSGTVTVSPSATTTYTLTATGPGGTTTAQATVSVGSGTTCSPASPAPSVTICSPANGSSVTSPVHVVAVPNSNNGVIGMAVYFDNNLAYKTTANYVDIMVNAATGTHSVVVQFWDNSGNVPAKASETVTVLGTTPAPSINFSASPTTISSGQSSTLTWSTSDATSVTIDNGIGSQPTAGSISVSPTATTTYTLTATGPGGTSTARATVTVGTFSGTCSPASPAPSVTICTPVNGSTVPSPVRIVAVPNSNTGVLAMAVYLDNNLAYEGYVSSVDTLVNTTSGSHYIVVQYWDNNGNVPAKASANITVSGMASIAVSPPLSTIYPNQTQQFTATYNGSPINVTWSVDGVVGGSSSSGPISTSGLYTAPGSPGAHQITATAVSNSAVSSTVVQNVVDPNQAMITYHNNGARTGVNSNEMILSPSNVNPSRFGKITAYPVDGQVYAQPLYVPNLTFNGAGRNFLFVATEHDSVYALDADGTTSTPYWQVSLLGPGQTTVPSGDTAGIKPEVGITSTPVIDRANNVMYVLAYVYNGTTNEFWLHALDLYSGAERFGGPKQVTATVAGTGTDSVNGQIQLESGCWQRSGLALNNGVLYLAFGHCPHGWVLAYDASTLNQTAVFNSTPNGAGGTIWMGGGAPAFDNSGNVYVMTGTNFGAIDGSGYNDAFLKLTPSLNLLDYFIPSDNSILVANDVDLGAGAPVILPDNSSSYPHEVVGAGKDGRIFLVNRDGMGQFDPNADHVIQEIQSGTTQYNNFHDTPAFWNNKLYYHSNADVLRVFSWSNGLLSTSPTQTGSTVFAAHGATPSISANGGSNGIVWELQNDGQPTNPTILHAYDANNIANELYNSTMNPGDTAGPAVKFTVPTVVNGKVYVPAGNQVDIYGLVH